MVRRLVGGRWVGGVSSLRGAPGAGPETCELAGRRLAAGNVAVVRSDIPLASCSGDRGEDAISLLACGKSGRLELDARLHQGGHERDLRASLSRLRVLSFTL